MSDKSRVLSKRINELMADLEREHPEHGFLIVAVGDVEGVEHVDTFSNMDGDSITAVASLLVQVDEQLEDLGVSHGFNRDKLH